MMQPIVIAAATLLAALPTGTPPVAHDSAQVIHLHRFRKALWKVEVTVNGKAGEFLLDTGGGNTFLTAEFGQAVHCRFWGRTTGYNMFGERNDGPHCDDVEIVADGVNLTPVNVSTIDFGDRFEGDKKPDGLLSLDAFDGKAFTFDQRHATLTIETPASLAERTRDMTELPFRVSRECSARCLSVFVGVPTREGTAWLILDSGAGGVSLIASEYAATFGLQAGQKEQRLQYRIADGVTVDSPVLVRDLIMDGNLGQPFMSQYIITFDLAAGRLWVKKAAP